MTPDQVAGAILLAMVGVGALLVAVSARPAPAAEPATDLEDLADAVGVLIRR